MGRKPYKNFNLPKGMRARKRGKNTYYYLDTGGKPRKEIPLGSDYAIAVLKWSELTMGKTPNTVTFEYVAAQYFDKVVPSKAPRTQKDNEAELDWLLKFFNKPPAPLDQIEPKHIRLYLDWRVQQAQANALKLGRDVTSNTGSVRANREKALFSHIWNFAREYGYTSLVNPCAGVKSYKETGRNVYIDDKTFNAVLICANKPLQFAMRLAHLTGQRQADILKIKLFDIHDGYLHIKQNKTSSKLRIIIEHDLRVLIDEMIAYKNKVSNKIQNMSLLVNECGKAFTSTMLKYQFMKARELAAVDFNSFQFKDIRAKSATETDEQEGIIKAQSLLGHSTQNMTTHYVRNTAGRIVNPLELRNTSAKNKKG